MSYKIEIPFSHLLERAYYLYSCIIIPSKGMKVIVLFFLCGIFPHIQYTSGLRAIYGVIKLSYYVTVKFPHGILQELTIFKTQNTSFCHWNLKFLSCNLNSNALTN